MSPAPTTSPKSLSLSSLTKIPPAQRLQLMLVVIAGFTLFIAYSGIYMPWKQKHAQLENLLAEERQRGELFTNLNLQRGQIKNQENKVLVQGGTASLPSEISRLASEANLEVESVTPKTDISFGPYTQHQVQVSVTASFADLLRFLRTLEKYEPLLKLDEVRLGDLSLGDRINRYRLLGQEEPPLPFDNTQQKAELLVSAFSRREPEL